MGHKEAEAAEVKLSQNLPWHTIARLHQTHTNFDNN